MKPDRHITQFVPGGGGGEVWDVIDWRVDRISGRVKPDKATGSERGRERGGGRRRRR